jgi:Glyoxalase-like domain
VSARLDHLVVAAATLAEGRSWVEEELGVPLEGGGRHEAFGTHNALLRLGTQSYLEVIAVDPAAGAPARRRWFELGTPALARRLGDGPVLVHWVVAVSRAALAAAAPVHGQPLDLSRGDNRWTLTVPDDGSLPMGGVLPSLIAWTTTPPARSLQDRGVELRRLALATPEAGRLRACLAALDLVEPPVVVDADHPSLKAILQTPLGLVSI